MKRNLKLLQKRLEEKLAATKNSYYSQDSDQKSVLALIIKIIILYEELKR